MVLTNFELWAADGSSGSPLPLNFESHNLHARHLNPFDPRAVPQINTNLNHLSSNGYYGFSYVNAAHEVELNNNNVSNINLNNNNSTTNNLMRNDAIGHSNVARCKKRFFAMNDNDDVSDCRGTNEKNYNSNSSEVSAKRCRFDQDYAAQYCNDFFQLPSTQIATQSCLMDTEGGLTLPLQHQVDEEMFETSNNIEKYEQTINPQLQTSSAEQHSHQQLLSPQQQQQETQQPHLYHQQQHYQDIQFATIKCHFNHNNNCDTLANNQTHKIELEKNNENVLKNYNPNSIQSANDKNDNDVANDFKVDDATLFAQLHGGCLHHHDRHFSRSISLSGRYFEEI